MTPCQILRLIKDAQNSISAGAVPHTLLGEFGAPFIAVFKGSTFKGMTEKRGRGIERNGGNEERKRIERKGRGIK